MNSKITSLIGNRFHTELTLNNYLLEFKKIIPEIDRLICNEVFVLKFNSNIDPKRIKNIDSLYSILGVEESQSISLKNSSSFFTFPRQGTISPWSSKSTDILLNSGISNLERIERGLKYSFKLRKNGSLKKNHLLNLAQVVVDRMIEEVFLEINDVYSLFSELPPQPFNKILISKHGKKALELANVNLGLALNSEEVNYLHDNYKQEDRDPSDAELMMFAQANSEHCRHKIFNATWSGDNLTSKKSLFQMIKNTFEQNKEGVLSAYADNASVLEGYTADRFFPDSLTREYKNYNEPIHIVTKVETHNHPTAIAPLPGAATGSGGEIRDEGATGRGAKPKAGLTGFSVSNLRIPGNEESWEGKENSPPRIANPLRIMIEAPVGAADYNNEFGRPNLLGYFRTFEQEVHDSFVHGYHKPIMLAGGLGNIREEDVNKSSVPIGSKLFVLGGPAMLIGLGGGSASSLTSGSSEDDLDFASVQRANAEMERRCQEVLDSCWQMCADNPILFIHDVGAGGLSNAIPELIKDSGHGGLINLRDIPSSETRMSPMEIWCNESQERYVLAIEDKLVASFLKICSREKCPYAEVGRITKGKRLKVYDHFFDNYPINISLDVLFGKTPKMEREYKSQKKVSKALTLKKESLDVLFSKVLRHPTVAAKNFLITIGDRTVSGLVSRDQMVGPWQVPVADNAVTLASYTGLSGEAMSIGEKSPLSISNAAASSRMAVAEAVTNLISSGVEDISHIKLSANWMGAPDRGNGNTDLYDAVKAIGIDLCPDWNITIPVGKDSLSMATDWNENSTPNSVVSPLSLVISSFCKIRDVSLSITPQLSCTPISSSLIFIDLGKGNNRMGGSIAGQVQNQVLGEVPDVEVVKEMPNIVSLMASLIREKKILAYHDRSDGGLITCLAEMSFAGRVGLDIDLKSLCRETSEVDSVLFSEELGFIIQVNSKHSSEIITSFSKLGMHDHVHILGTIKEKKSLNIKLDSKVIGSWKMESLLKEWYKVSFCIQDIRDNSLTAKSEFLSETNNKKIGLTPKVNFNFLEEPVKRKIKPYLAILREQGVNGQVEMAAAFDRVGFKCVDVHMSDLATKKDSLKNYKGVVACGGFSYGDVLGAGRGWAAGILNNKHLKEEFEEFFQRNNAFSLGVCNGCQMMSNLASIIPGANTWPSFLKNRSEKFEARLVQVAIQESPSIFFKGMEGSIIPIPVAHGEGRPDIDDTLLEEILRSKCSPAYYSSGELKATESYPDNPNGAIAGVAALTNTLGNSTIMMPHPERAFLTIQYSWAPNNWGKYGPWIKFFQNAREFIT